jgi:hypothetical protein
VWGTAGKEHTINRETPMDIKIPRSTPRSTVTTKVKDKRAMSLHAYRFKCKFLIFPGKLLPKNIFDTKRSFKKIPNFQ